MISATRIYCRLAILLQETVKVEFTRICSSASMEPNINKMSTIFATVQ